MEDEGVSDENCPEDLTSQDDINTSNASKVVPDGVALLHHVTWEDSTFKDVVQDYISYVNSKYGSSTVVLDGYTKDTADLQKTMNIEDVQCRYLRVQMFL